MTTLLVWFFYINLAALAFSLLGWLGEWILLAHRRQVRWLWTGLMFASVILPLALILWGEQLISVQGLSSLDDAVAEGLLRASGNEVAFTADGAYRLQSGFDGWIQVFWGATTGGALVWLAWSAHRLHSARSRWLPTNIGGRTFYITPSIGPGVMGVIRQRVLLPEWFLGLDEEEQEMIWQHEREHVRAGDNRLLATAFALLVAFPWVLPLWWQFRRLRVAVELDCDQRVVARSGQWRDYGELLLRVAEGSTLLPVAPFASKKSPLRRRIECLLPERPSNRGLRSAGAALTICLLVVGWLALPVPAEGNNWSLLPLPLPVVRETLSPSPSQYDQPQERLNDKEFARAVRQRYPETLKARGVEGRVGLMIHVTAGGTVDEVRLDRPSKHQEFNQIAREVAFMLRYEPPRRNGSPVDSWLFIPVEFQLPDSARAASSP